MSLPSQPRRLRLMAALAQQAGQPFLTLDLPPDATAGALRAHLGALYPHMEPLVRTSLVVADDRVLGEDAPLPAQATLALLPPMKGG